MKQRYLYAFIFGIPGVPISAFAAIFAGGAATGLFWIVIFGDSLWPFWTEWIITVIGVTVFIIALFFIVKIGFSVGKKREIENIPINNKHIVISLATTALLVFRMIVFQRGYIFKKPQHKVCYDLCIQKGYEGVSTSVGREISGKSMCSCWNNATGKYDEVGNID